MSYEKQKIRNAIQLHTVITDKFKTNLLAIFLTIPIDRKNITKNALLPMVLRRGTANLKTQEEISKHLEQMYGATFDCGIDKIGDNYTLKFYIESLNDNYLPQKEDILKKDIETIIDIVLNPYIENEMFKEEYITSEKENLRQIIKSKIDDKARYSLDRCIEEMYKNEPYGLYKEGYVEDLENINSKNLYEYYKQLINLCKMDILVSGNIQEDIQELLLKNNCIKNLKDRDIILVRSQSKKEQSEINEISESMDITQGKLVIGLDILNCKREDRYTASLYNTILGGTANSKLFQNVREKNSLAYTASSSYMKQKNNIFIRCGIDIPNYEQALKIIKEQLEDMKNGKFDQKDIENAKQSIISMIRTIDDEQDTQITYFFGQDIEDMHLSFEEYIEKINNITKDEIVKIANNIYINTIYFLKNK